MLLPIVLLLLAAEPDAVVPPDARLEKVWGEGIFTEGGALMADGSILFSDIGDRIMRFDPKTGKTVAFRDPGGRSNGMIYDPKGRLIVAEGANTGGNRRVTATDPDGTVRVLADKYQGKKFNSPNDVAVDAQGRVYVSDPRYVGKEPRELDFEAVFRIDPDGSVHKLETTATKPNGLAVSPDGKTLYIADNGSKRRALLACDLDARGNVSNPRALLTFDDGGIDGMTVTADGLIVATKGKKDANGVTIFAPDGKTVGFIPVPEDTTNVEFGGDDRKTLYITAGVGLYRIKTNLTGFHLWPKK